MSKTKVLYILGWGRNGSTVLGNVLGQMPGFFFAGEVRHFWDLGWHDNALCGCGKPLHECDQWKEIYLKAFGDSSELDMENIASLRNRFHARDALIRSLVFRGERVLPRHMLPYQNYLKCLYKGINDVTGSKVIVDSSKFPSCAYILTTISEVEPFFVHFVRDPRAVAFSWQRKKLLKNAGRSEYIRQASPLFSTVVWNSWNLTAEIFRQQIPDRFIRLRYEDFVVNPQPAIQEILKLVHETPDILPTIQDNRVTLAKCHSVMGNPNRFTTGIVELKEDTEWKKALKPRDRLLVTALSWPWLRYYHYL